MLRSVSRALRRPFSTASTASATAFDPFSALPPPGHPPPVPRVTIVEMGPRDGLQNEKTVLGSDVKVELINRLNRTGLPKIEVASFVSPKWVPQMASADEVFSAMDKVDGIDYPVLCPNLRGLERALAVGAKEIAVFASASEAFSQRNINCSIADSLARYRDVVREAQQAGVKVRGYVSCVVACPYEGIIEPSAVLATSERLFDMGVYEVSLGDTIGAGTPGSIERLLDHIIVDKGLDPKLFAIHAHDTYGQGLVNILAALRYGISTVDASVAGLGGCPYAKGATGNVATEDVVYMCKGLGIETGVDILKLAEAGKYICDALGRPTTSRAAAALQAKLP